MEFDGPYGFVVVVGPNGNWEPGNEAREVREGLGSKQSCKPTSWMRE